MRATGSRTPRHSATTPAPSAVMPVRRGFPHLDQAIENILLKTFHEFEFVVLDDTSRDGSGERLRKWATLDSRIQLLKVNKISGQFKARTWLHEPQRLP